MQWAKIEQQRLFFLRQNQSTIRREVYETLQSVASSATQQRMGQRVILPTSFIGGPRYMNQLYHDGMAIVRKVGKADLFVTFTANPNWPEVLAAIAGKESCLQLTLQCGPHVFFAK